MRLNTGRSSAANLVIAAEIALALELILLAGRGIGQGRLEHAVGQGDQRFRIQVIRPLGHRLVGIRRRHA